MLYTDNADCFFAAVQYSTDLNCLIIIWLYALVIIAVTHESRASLPLPVAQNRLHITHSDMKVKSNQMKSYQIKLKGSI